MPANNRKVPSYTHHKASGRAVVRLDGRDHYLGPFGSPESHALLIAQWQLQGGTTSSPGRRVVGESISINELLLAYVEFARGYYTKDGRNLSR